VDKFSQACLSPGDCGLDMFCGSGSTLLSVINHGGYAIGYDIQPEYLDMTRKRILEEAE
jgi:DNA modification methylase